MSLKRIQWKMILATVFLCIFLYFSEKLNFKYVGNKGKEKLISTREEVKEKKIYSFSLCSCNRSGLSALQVSKDEQSTCSEFATQRGKNQKVFSYSYYNPHKDLSKVYLHNERFLKPIMARSIEVEKYFPGWFIRIYNNISSEDSAGSKILCRLFCSHNHVDLCDVRDLPTIGNLAMKQPIGRTWRFAVMGDPTISIFNSRDTDSVILERERAAVADWLNSDKTFHVMRDHPRHKTVMLAGLWGAKNERKVKELAKYRDEMFSQPPDYYEKFDQELLKNIVWPNIQKDVMQHDSYTCEMESHANSIAFPTKRAYYTYLGWGPTKIKESKLLRFAICPVECRPPDHKDWEQC